MSTATALSQVQRSAAHAWFEQHLLELTSRGNVYVQRLPRPEREEAVADVLASIFKYAVNVERRGKLHSLTPYTLVLFFGRAYCQGRRMAGYTSTDVLSEAGRRRHRLRIVSLSEPHETDAPQGQAVVPLSDVLADPKADQPPENARRNIDYPEILDREEASPKAWRVFEFLCETNSEGKQSDLARELGVSPARIRQLKHELADCLANEGYLPPATRPSNKPSKKRGRPRFRTTPRAPGDQPGRCCIAHH